MSVNKYYTNLIALGRVESEPNYCHGKGWFISLEPNPNCGILTRTKNMDFGEGSPACEIVINAHYKESAQNINDLILAAYCLYTADVLTLDERRVVTERATTPLKLEEQFLNGGILNPIGVYSLPESCLIVATASQRLSFQYALCKYLLSCQILPID